MSRHLYRPTIEWRRIAQYAPVQVDGVGLNNEDGSHRQQVLFDCQAGTRVVVKRNLKSTDNSNAVALFLRDGRQIGYLTQNVAAWVAPLLESIGGAFDAEIWSLDRVPANDGRTQIGCTVALTQFESLVVERFSWALAFAAVVRLSAKTTKWTASQVASMMPSSVKRPAGLFGSAAASNEDGGVYGQASAALGLETADHR